MLAEQTNAILTTALLSKLLKEPRFCAGGGQGLGADKSQ